MKKLMILALAVVVSASSLTACTNAYHGAGKDVENMGEKMQDPAR